MSISAARANRPTVYGPMDRHEFYNAGGEVAMRAENDANGNPIYFGRAKPGTLNGEVKWQICFMAWDGNNSLTSLTWPQNSLGNASKEFEFEWDERASYTYS